MFIKSVNISNQSDIYVSIEPLDGSAPECGGGGGLLCGDPAEAQVQGGRAADAADQSSVQEIVVITITNEESVY